MKEVSRTGSCVTPLLVSLTLLLAACKPAESPEFQAACHGGRLSTVEEREQALVQGYTINQRFDCIDKRSWEEVQRATATVEAMVARAAAEAKQAQSDATAAALERSQRSPDAPTALVEARRAHPTGLSAPGSGVPLPDPPANLFVRSDYESPDVGSLAAWITPDPGDGERHPAIVWLTGGDSSSLDDFWTEGSADDNESASAFRKAGVVMMFPTLRGGNTNPGRKEYFYGEVDDVIAAADHLASLPWVGPVYLGGHSTGGTLALLVAESTRRFHAVFAFGPVRDAVIYGSHLLPFDLVKAPAAEQNPRAPILWLEEIATPTYLIEGREAPGNTRELEALCEHTRNPAVICISVPGRNHFSVLEPVTRKLAARIVVRAPGDGAPLLKAPEFAGSD